MKLSAKGLSLIKHFESCYLTAYKDGGGVWTIGWGHTGLQHQDGTVYKGLTITREKATELLDYDMDQFEKRVNALVKVPLTQDQFDALVSFDFNTGGLTLKGGVPSTLLKNINAGRYWEGVNEFARWNKDNGSVVAGLTRRRSAERDLFAGFNWERWAA